MRKKYIITEEEFGAIKEAIEAQLDLFAYKFIEANDGHGRATSMSKETFFEGLRGQFIINPSA